MHIEQGLADPTQNTHLLQYLCTGIRRSRVDAPRHRLPITISILHTLHCQLERSDTPSQDKLLYWAAFTLAFFCFLRASEYTSPSHHYYNPAKHLSLTDVSLKSQSLQICIKRSKTDKFGRTAKILVGSTGSSICPVRAMKKYLHNRTARPPGPLFTSSNGQFLTRRDVSSMLKSVLHSAGLDPQRYSSHSLRIGAATAAAHAGLPDHLIKTLGRWRCNAYQGYIHSSPQILYKATSQISQAH